MKKCGRLDCLVENLIDRALLTDAVVDIGECLECRKAKHLHLGHLLKILGEAGFATAVGADDSHLAGILGEFNALAVGFGRE